ncbi:MAG: formate dehydrogenase accessory protein FdhE, partial [Raoultibacter sp.]
MNRIDAAIEAYTTLLSPHDTDRLRFFKGLIEVQDRHAQLAVQAGGYTPPAESEAQTWYRTEKPVFLMAPVPIDADRLTSSLEDVACYLIDHAGFSSETADALRFFDWRGCIDSSDCKRAGSDPVAYIESICESHGNDSDEAEVSPETLALVLAYGLRPLLEPAALSIMSSLDLKQANENYNRPRTCPACGAHAAAATVGPTPSGASNGKMLYCALCGTTWEFERIRCANCGTQN